MKAIIEKQTEVGTIVYTNRIIQIGYDFICSGSKELEIDFENELKRQNISLEMKQEILNKIKSDFDL